MKILADQVLRTWTGSPALGAASQSYGLTTVNLASWMQEDTHGKSEMMIFSKSQMKPITNLCSHLNIAPQLSFRYDKWFSLRNEYDRPFEMSICTCVVKPFGFLQLVIHYSEWQLAESRMVLSRRCKSSFRKEGHIHFEGIVICHIEKRVWGIFDCEQRLVLGFIWDFERIIISDLPCVSSCIQEGKFTMVNRISATLRRVLVFQPIRP